MKTVNYLDTKLNLENSTYYPYQKENNQIRYINTEFNHPPSVNTQFPLSVESWLSSLSSSEEIFNDSVTPYQTTLDKSGYKHKLKYQSNIITPNNKKQRKRNIIWFNPPFNKSVKANIGKMFLIFIKKHFPSHHKFHKLLNKNTVKISYSCPRSIKTIINFHNAKIFFNNKSTEQRTCNCLNKDNCPLEQKCLATNIVYKAKVTSGNRNYQEKVYSGFVKPPLKSDFQITKSHLI